MQENRSFDHYFGALSGVRGFGDPHAKGWPPGARSSHQPDAGQPRQLPAAVPPRHHRPGGQAMPSLSHRGRFSTPRWNTATWTAGCAPTSRRTATRRAVHHGLLHGRRHPVPVRPGQRLHHLRQLLLLGARADPSEPLHVDDRHGRPRRAGRGPALDNNVTNGTYSWTTMAERLQNAGISWKCYQQADNTAPTCSSSSASSSTPPRPLALYQNAFGVSTLLNGSRPATRPWPSRRTAPTGRCRR